MKPAGKHDKESFSKESSYALEQMMEKHGTTVLRTAYFYTRDQYLSEDISQEVFIRAYRNWSKFRGESQVKTWLTKITINLCHDKLGLKLFSEQPTDPSSMELNSGTLSVEEEALEQLEKSQILKWVLSLPMLYQEVLYLYYYLDFTTREIAETVAAPEGTVRGRLHRARELLGQVLEEKEAVGYDRARKETQPVLQEGSR